jgi:putative ABC transport system permease protein
MLKLALRNIFRHRLRTALTLAAIMAGVMVLILSGGFIEDLFVQLREATIHSQLGHIQIYQSGYFQHGRRDPYHYMIANPDSLVAEIGSQPHVTQIMRRLNFSGLLTTGHADIPIAGEAVEPRKEERLGSSISLIAGHMLSRNSHYGVMVGEGVAQALQLHPDDYVTLVLNTPDGALNSMDLQVAGVFRTMSKDYDAHAIRISLQTGRDLLLTDAVHALVVSLDHTENTQAVVASLRQRLKGADVEIKPWYELADFYQKTVDLYRRQFAVLQIITLVLVLLGVANSVNMAVYERTGEFGTLLALGNTPRQVGVLIILETVLLGLIGAAGGVLLAIVLATLISAIGIPMPPPPNMNSGYSAIIRLLPQTVVGAFAIGIAATVLAAIIPARRAMRRPVVEALRYNI